MASEKQFGCVFLIKWILVNAFALVVGLLFYTVFDRMVFIHDSESSHIVSMADILGGISIGIVIGFVQSALMKPWLLKKPWWTFATILGWPFAMIWFDNPIREFNILNLFYLLLPLVLGICQWFVLRRIIRRAGWWILWSYFGLTLSFFVLNYLSEKFSGVSNTIYPFAPLILIWLVPIPYGVITGVGLLWMMGGRKGITELVLSPKADLKDDRE